MNNTLKILAQGLVVFFLFYTNSYALSSYDKITSSLEKISASASHLELFTLGRNDQGNDIKGIIYRGDKTSAKAGVTNHLVVSTHHGNEILSAELAVKFIEHLAFKGSSLFKDQDLYIVPVLNIGGYNQENREERDQRGKSFDPNRDYPDPCISKKDFNLKSTALLANLVRSRNIVGAITLHGYYGSLTYPWGIYTDNYETLDHKIFKEKTNQAVQSNGYITGTHADILYPAGGAFEDWAYFELGVWSLLVELENSPRFDDDVQMLISSVKSFPKIRSSDHRHLGNCTQQKDLGISRP